MIKKAKKVITYGTFDLLHPGHINLIKRAKELGDFLIVAVSTDEFNLLKNKKSFFPYDVRIKMIEALPYVDLVIPEKTWEQKRLDIEEYEVSTFVIGKDWEGKFDDLKDMCEVVYLERTPGISATLLRKSLDKL